MSKANCKGRKVSQQKALKAPSCVGFHEESPYFPPDSNFGLIVMP